MLLAGTLFTSCLKHDLPTLPAYTDADITDLYAQYRYYDTETSADGNQVVRIENFAVSDKIFEKENAGATVTVPPASEFDVPEERDKVAASNIVLMCNISTGATIAPVEGAPALGSPGDYSKPQRYLVTAADGKTKKTWTISITLVK